MSSDVGARDEGFHWVVLGQNPPEIAYWERQAGVQAAADACSLSNPPPTDKEARDAAFWVFPLW
jgi:hypothetical protein